VDIAQVHAMNVMNAVNMVVESLDDIPKLVNELTKLGKSHGRNNIQVSHFRVQSLSSFNQFHLLVDNNQS
jgi:hypothetical protein